MYFIDANIFLELLLDEERADDCEVFLERVRNGSIEGVTTDFIIDSIVLVMERWGKKPSELLLFLSSLLGYKSLQTHFLSLYERIEATKHMQSLNLDFDDSTTCQAMRSLRLDQIVSFDTDFDNVPGIKRIEPRETQQE
ncbi:type II toxin-antitoxin system VapC family toxin [Candidatus Bathyarchaeota archaeon]|nr:type II toxin-antitoxin system VapC family toxin [Candidatus Bathyarchaeota archaeon]